MTDTWTVEDAAALLDPPMTVEQVRALVRAASIQPAGSRRTGRRGRPAEVYDAAVILRAHAALAPLLVEAEATALRNVRAGLTSGNSENGALNGGPSHFVI